jgi:tetratricopeptide (TPR) repeat protein
MTYRTILFLLFVLKTFILFSQNSIASEENKKMAEKFYELSTKFENKNIDSSLYYNQKAFQILKQKDTLKDLYVDVLNQYGRIYFFKQDFNTAYNYFKRCFKISLYKNDEKSAFKVKVNMATCQNKLDNHKKAIEEFYEIIAYYEKNEPASLSLGITYFNVAGTYQRINNFELTEDFYKKALPFFKERKNSYLQIQGNRIGNFNKFDVPKANSIVKNLQATVNYDSIPKYIKSAIYTNIGQTKKLSKQFDEAIKYTLESLEFKKSSGIKHDVSIAYNNVGEIYLQKKEYEIAIKYLDSGLLNTNIIRQKLAILKNLQKAHKRNGNVEESLKYANGYIQIKDSLNEVLSKKELVELGLKYKTKTNDKIIKKLTNLSLFYKILLVLLLITGFYFVVTLLAKNKNIKRESAVIQKELEEFKKKNTTKKVANQIIHLKSKAVVNCNELLYVKSDGHYAEFYIEGKNIPEIDRNSLIEVYKMLPSDSFVRTHKSYIVNIHKIKIINATKLMLENGQWLNLSRTYKQALKDILHKV